MSASGIYQRPTMDIDLSGVVYFVRGIVARANLFAVGSHSWTSRSLLILNVTQRLASARHLLSTFLNYFLRLFLKFVCL